MYNTQYHRKRDYTNLHKAMALFLCFAMLITSFHFVVIAAEAKTTDTVNITVNYVYASNQSMVAQPYRAQITKGSEFKKSLEIPKLFNYSIPADKAEGLGNGIELSKNESDNTYSLNFDLASVENDFTVTLYYVAGTAKYTVYHYYQNLEDDDYSTDPKVVELTGDIDAYTDAVADSKPGYHCKGVPQTTIAADGTTKVEIYYDRDYYTVVFDVNGGVNGPEPIYAKYGTTFEVKDIRQPKRTGYTFMGWSPFISDTVTIEGNVTYKAVWQADKGQADYTIVIWGQNANNDEYSYIDSYEAWGNVGNQVTWNENTLINHVHTDECYSGCDKEPHKHTDDCYICGKTEHTHNTDCCSLTEHKHTGACYPGGTATVTSPLMPPSNPVNGQVYKRLWFNGVYYNGQWYEYSGNANNGDVLSMSCTQSEHTHGINCIYDCGLEEHTHVTTCIGCGKEEHTHSTDCSTLICELDTTEKKMGALHPGAALWVYEKSDTVTVEPDGSTVLNVYFTRKEFTLNFRKPYSNNNDYGSITARWGKNIKSEYEAIVEKAGSSFWTENSNSEGPYTNYIGVMPQEDITYYNHTTSGHKKNTMTYYAEDLNGQYQQIFQIEFYGNYSVTKEDRYEFEGFTYDHGTKLGAECAGAEFYYKRNEYKLEFYSASKNNPDKSENVKYQSPLANYDYTPTNKPGTVEEDAIFVGWYQNPECTGDRYDLASHTMPSHNIALYAKWVNGLYTVRTFTDDTLHEFYTYDGYSGVQKNIEKYTLATEPAAPSKDGYVFVGWFYKEGDAEKPFSFTMPITRDYDLYPKFSEPTAVTYTVHYYKKGTTQKIADDRVNSVMIGTTVTEKAKMGTELNLLDAALQNKYYPTNTSTSVIINKGNQEIIFEYTEATSVQYTVYYQDANGNNLIDPVTKTTDYSTVTEFYVSIPNYAPRQYSITQDLSSEADKNKIIFVYDPTLTTLTITKSGANDIDVNQTFLFQVKGTDDITKGIDITVTIHGNGNVTIADLPIGNYTVQELSDWSWRYEAIDNVDTKEITIVPGDNSITFTNTREKKQWLDGDSYKINKFTGIK